MLAARVGKELAQARADDAGNGGDVVIGRNFDGASYRPHFIVSSEMDEGFRVLGKSCYAPYHWVTDGVNEHGLFAGVSTNGHPKQYNYRDLRYPTEPAVQVIHMVRICLETCRTVEEAAELFRSVSKSISRVATNEYSAPFSPVTRR